MHRRSRSRRRKNPTYREVDRNKYELKRGQYYIQRGKKEYVIDRIDASDRARIKALRAERGRILRQIDSLHENLKRNNDKLHDLGVLIYDD